MGRKTFFRLVVAGALLSMAVSVDLMRPQSSLTAHIQPPLQSPRGEIDNPVRPAIVAGNERGCMSALLRSV